MYNFSTNPDQIKKKIWIDFLFSIFSEYDEIQQFTTTSKQLMFYVTRLGYCLLHQTNKHTTYKYVGVSGQ